MYKPSKEFSSKARISTAEEYDTLYEQSISNPDEFWSKQAKENLDWLENWTEVCNYDFDVKGKNKFVSWFKGGKLNPSHNCLDRHLQITRPAIIWQGEAEEETRTISFKELHTAVCKFANTMKSQGVKKGDVVTIYMPMLPEVVVAMLACARIGAIHSVVFSAFSAEALKSRIEDCSSKFVITSDISMHAGKSISLKEKVDTAVKANSTVEKVFVYQRGTEIVNLKEGRDILWQKAIEEAAPDCSPTPLDSEDPLFILYTSGSTGKPKGIYHTAGGYSLWTHLTFKYTFDYQPSDIFWCTADVGWITGHSYLVYGPLSNGATCVMYEGAPTYPKADRFWKIVEKFKVSVFYTAPTAIRSFMGLGDELPNNCDLSSLRLLGSVGEPINPEAWRWYYDTIGNNESPVVDTWWQTETGGHMITTLPGAHEMKPGSAGKPFFGVEPKIIKQNTEDEGGPLVITKPWPGMLRGIWNDEGNELLNNVYFSAFPGNYFSGDGCKVDKEGYHWLLGRIDDVLNVAGHRLSTAEIESALVEHESVSEAAVVGYPHDTKGQGIYCYVSLMSGVAESESLAKELITSVRELISPIATPDQIHFTPGLPNTRSGKIMRRILRKIASGETDSLGDTSTLADPTVVETLANGKSWKR